MSPNRLLTDLSIMAAPRLCWERTFAGTLNDPTG